MRKLFRDKPAEVVWVLPELRCDDWFTKITQDTEGLWTKVADDGSQFLIIREILLDAFLILSGSAGFVPSSDFVAKDWGRCVV